MGILPANVSREHASGHKEFVIDLTWDASYPTGGESFAAADIGLGSIISVEHVWAKRSGAYSSDKVDWDPVNNKLLLFTVAGVQLTNASDQSALVTRVRVCGRG